MDKDAYDQDWRIEEQYLYVNLFQLFIEYILNKIDRLVGREDQSLESGTPSTNL
jgi:hypothetical protein